MNYLVTKNYYTRKGVLKVILFGAIINWIFGIFFVVNDYLENGICLIELSVLLATIVLILMRPYIKIDIQNRCLEVSNGGAISHLILINKLKEITDNKGIITFYHTNGYIVWQVKKKQLPLVSFEQLKNGLRIINDTDKDKLNKLQISIQGFCEE